MPGRVHKHPDYGVNFPVYHRADGALIIHGCRHSRYMPSRDAKVHATKRPEKQGYPQAGDGRPKHKGKNERIHKKKSKRRGKGRRKR